MGMATINIYDNFKKGKKLFDTLGLILISRQDVTFILWCTN